MPSATRKTTKATTTKGRRPSASRAQSDSVKKVIDESLERLRTSLEAADAAVKDLRSGAGKGSRDLIRDLEQALEHARSNASRVSNAVAKDLEGLQAALRAEKRPARAKKRPTKTSQRSTKASRSG